MERFSRENINKKLKYIESVSRLETFKHIVAILIDTFPYIGFFASAWLLLATQSLFFLISSLIFAVLSVFFFYINVINFNEFKVNRYEIPIKGLKETFKFIFVSDLHMGSERAATDKEKILKLASFANTSGLDTIILGGDFVHEHIDPQRLSDLSGIRLKNKIAVYGNHDSQYLKEKQDSELPYKFIEAFRSTGFNLLINEAVEIDNIYFGGIPDLFSKSFDLDKTFNGLKGELKILVSHNPDIIDFIEKKDEISLVLSGHNHAGQINLPYIGPVLPMPGRYRWMQRGLYELKNTKLFISQGFGSGGARTRIGTEAEVCIITLVPSEV